MSKRANDRANIKNQEDGRKHKEAKLNKEKRTQQNDDSDSEPEEGELSAHRGNRNRAQKNEGDDAALGPELLLALGSEDTKLPIYGDPIHNDLAKRWLPILRDGLSVDAKEKILKDVAIPANCKLLKAPTLNPETIVGSGDHYYEARQHQLGQGITLLSKGISMIFQVTEENKTLAVSMLSNAARILCDLHFLETQNRRRLISRDTRIGDDLYKIVLDSKHDEYLFGSDLPDKIKESKASANNGVQVSNSVPKPSTSQPRTYTHPLFDGPNNTRGTARSSNRRGGRLSYNDYQDRQRY